MLESVLNQPILKIEDSLLLKETIKDFGGPDRQSPLTCQTLYLLHLPSDIIFSSKRMAVLGV